MHYKNGREAKNGDPVVGKIWNNITAGIIHSIVPGSTSCNCTVAVPVMGGVNQMSCVNINDLYHAEDAYVAVNGGNESSVGAPTPAPAGSPPATPPPGGWPKDAEPVANTPDCPTPAAN